jgi:hypothetical protein
MVEQDGYVVIKNGARYLPLSSAAPLAQTHKTTLVNWIKTKKHFSGRPLQTYYLAALCRYLISEESVQRVKNRFVKWPSLEPAGAVMLGKTQNRRGFLTISEAGRMLGVSRRTMWLWAARGKAPADNPVDVIKCPISNQLYIREKDVCELKKLIPQSGLPCGRRHLYR